MRKISYKGYRFPAEIIQQAIWHYLRFTLSFRDIEDLLAERGRMFFFCALFVTLGLLGSKSGIQLLNVIAHFVLSRDQTNVASGIA
jgi:hypothetical protein